MSPRILVKAVKRPILPVGRSPIHGGKPIRMVRVQGEGHSPMEEGVPPILQDMENRIYERNQQNPFPVGSARKATDKEWEDIKSGKLPTPYGSVGPYENLLGPQEPYIDEHGKKVLFDDEWNRIIEPSFASFWSPNNILDLSTAHPTGVYRDTPIDLLGTVMHPDELNALTRGGWQHDENTAEAFVPEHVPADSLVDMTPLVTSEAGYHPSWWNHPDEKDPEHAYAEERKFRDMNSTVDFDQYKDLLNFLNRPRFDGLQAPEGTKHLGSKPRDVDAWWDELKAKAKKNALAYDDDAGKWENHMPFEDKEGFRNAVNFMRENIYPREGHAMFHDLMRDSNIPNKENILRRISHDYPGRIHYTKTYPYPEGDEKAFLEGFTPYGKRLGYQSFMKLPPARREKYGFLNTEPIPTGRPFHVGDDLDRLQYELAGYGYVPSAREMPYHWWDEKTMETPERLGVDRQRLMNMAQELGQSLDVMPESKRQLWETGQNE